jgi:hypothetical protein
MKILQFNPTDCIADQVKNCFWFSTITKSYKLKKYLISSLDTYVFYYNDIHDAFLFGYFKFHLDIEPVFEMFGNIFIYCTVKFLPKSAVPWKLYSILHVY